MPPPIKKLSDKFLTDPKRIEVARPATANINIEQRLVHTTSAKKTDALKDLLNAGEFKNAIVFCNRKTTVRDLASTLKRARFAVGQIHGDMDQSSRIAEFDRFKNDEINILVASDVAARGLDVKGVSHVINYDVPWQPDDYIHRIGRTGRAGMKGIAITLATRADGDAIAAIAKLTGMKIDQVGEAPDHAGAEAGAPAERRSRQRQPAADKPQRRSRREQPVEPAVAKVSASKPVPKPPRPAKTKPPVVDDMEAEWNGPLPSFLSFGAS